MGIDPADLSRAFNLRSATPRTLQRIFDYYGLPNEENDPLLRLEHATRKLDVLVDDFKNTADEIAKAHDDYMKGN